MKVRYTSRALAQLEDVHDFLVKRSAIGAHNVSASLRATITRLSVLPHLGRTSDVQGVLVLIEPEYGYRVFYRIDRQVVTVIRILHRSQHR
jgi:plasmid stabilization system protein ParE